MNSIFVKTLYANKKNILIFVLLCLVFASYNLKKVNAVTQTTLSGSCGILANINYNGWDNKAANQQPNVLTKSAIGTINFDTGMANLEISVMTNYGGTSTIYEATSKSSGTATLSSFDSDTGIYKFTYLDDNGQTMSFSVLPVNSGNTFLISGQVAALSITSGPPFSGICQKV